MRSFSVKIDKNNKNICSLFFIIEAIVSLKIKRAKYLCGKTKLKKDG